MDEAFVTGILGGVTPVTKVDGRLIADGKPGPVTKVASELYLRLVGSLKVVPARSDRPAPQGLRAGAQAFM